MNLEKFCSGRLVMLPGDATAYDAARAMFSNHIGAVLVSEKGRLAGIVTDRDLALRVGPMLTIDLILLRDVMTPNPASVEVTASVDDVVSLMTERRVRRLVLLEEGKPRGIVTLDDLVLSREVSEELLQRIVAAQLSELAPHKPEGTVRPTRGRRPAARRHQAHRAHSLHAFGEKLQRITGLGAEAAALAAFEVVASSFVRRLTPQAGAHFTAQLPASLRERLDVQHGAPDRHITREVIDALVAQRLRVSPDVAADIVSRIGEHLAELVSEGEVDGLAAQLPIELKGLVHRAAPRA